MSFIKTFKYIICFQSYSSVKKKYTLILHDLCVLKGLTFNL